MIGNAGPNGVTEDVGVSNGKLSVSGQLSITDADMGEAFFSTVVISAAGNLGTLVLGRDGQYTYAVDNSLVQYLRASETRTESFTVTSADGTQKVISFVITGADDPTTITGPGTGDVAEAGGVDNWTSPDAFASGALTVSGDQGAAFVPVDEPTASAKGYGVYFMTAGGEWTYRVDNFNQTVEALNVGDTLTDSFIVRTTEGVTKTITITSSARTTQPLSTGSTSATSPRRATTRTRAPAMPAPRGSLPQPMWIMCPTPSGRRPIRGRPTALSTCGPMEAGLTCSTTPPAPSRP